MNKCLKLEKNGLVPEGCEYYSHHNNKTYKGGEKIPEPSLYDRFKTLDYTYCNETEDITCCDETINSYWAVHVNDRNKVVYEPLYENINGLPLKELYCTFENCENMESAPIIPSCVNDMQRAFAFCKSLKGEVTINAKIRDDDDIYYDECFLGCAKDKKHAILLKGTSNKLDELSHTYDGYITVQTDKSKKVINSINNFLKERAINLLDLEDLEKEINKILN